MTGVIDVMLMLALAPLTWAAGRRFGWPLAAAMVLVASFTLLPHHLVLFHITPKLAFGPLLVGSACAMIALIADRRTPRQRRPVSWLDAPVVLFCLAPVLPVVVHTGDAWPNGAAPALILCLTVLTAWAVGRSLSAEDWRRFSWFLAIVGLIYIPICLVEMFLGPSYYIQHFWGGRSVEHITAGADRLGGWRPIGMFANGIRLGRWMTVVTLVAAFASFTPGIRHRTRWLIVFAALLIVTVMCRSLSWLVFLAIGIGLLVTWRWISAKLALIGLVVLISAPIGYLGLRVTQVWDAQELIDVAAKASGPRSRSLAHRRDTETMYIGSTIDRNLWVGWGIGGDWYRYPRYVDQRWLYQFITQGLIGLASWVAMLVIPSLLLMWRLRAGLGPRSPDGWLIVPLVLNAFALVDGMFNMLANPIFFIAAGAVATAALMRREPTVTDANPAPVA